MLTKRERRWIGILSDDTAKLWLLSENEHGSNYVEECATGASGLHQSNLFRGYRRKIEETLAILKEIDRVYGNLREAIRKQVSSTPRRKRLAEVDLLHRRDSEPHLLRLAELQYRRMRASWLELH